MNRKYRICILFTWLLFPVYMYAQFEDTTRMQTVIWKISGNGLSQSSYLMGTHHLFGGSFLDSVTSIIDMLNSSDILIGENYTRFNTNPVPAAANPQLPEFIPYSKLFTAEQYSQVNNYLTSINVVPLKSLDSAQFPTWRLYFLIQMDFFSKKFKTATLTESSIDYYLLKLAQDKNLRAVGLDSLSKWKNPSTQELFGKPAQLAEGIVSMINYFEKGTPSIHISIPMQEFSSVNDYRNFSVQYQFNIPTPGKDIPVIKELVIQRNIAWLKVLPALLKAHSCFIAVGIKHLMYREGLIMQLKEMGYQVTPVAIQRKKNKL